MVFPLSLFPIITIKPLGILSIPVSYTHLDVYKRQLFGFSSQRNQRKEYLPIGNSRHGGRLIVVMKGGREFYIEWNHSKWTIKDKYENNIDCLLYTSFLLRS